MVKKVGIASVFLVLAGIICLYAYPKPFMEAFASYKAGRKVYCASMKLSWSPLRIEWEDVHIANAPWAEKPDMFHAGRIQAELNIFPFSFRRITVQDATLLLERDTDGTGNWKQRAQIASPSPDPEDAARGRRDFPYITDLSIQNSVIHLKTSSNSQLDIGFHNVKMHSEHETKPVKLEIDGAYNAIPVQLSIITDSYAALRQTGQGFGMDIHAQGATIDAHALMQFRDPLNFDGAQGTLEANIEELGQAMALAGDAHDYPVPLAFKASITRDGDDWKLEQTKGHIASSAFYDSSFRLREGKRNAADTIDLTANFDHMHVGPLIPSPKNSKEEHVFSFAEASEKAKLLLDLTVNAHAASYKSLQADDIKLHFILKPGHAGFDSISLHMFDGMLAGKIVENKTDARDRFQMELQLDRAHAPSLLSAIEVTGPLLTGRLNAQVTLTSIAGTLHNLLQTVSGKVHLSLSDATITRRAIWIASADPHALLMKDATMLPVRCMEAALTFRKGVGKLSPFTLASTEGTLFGAGTVNLPHNTLDLIFQTAPDTTGTFAFDAPIHIGGKVFAPAPDGLGSHEVAQSGGEACK